jgi:hypothetical protein
MDPLQKVPKIITARNFYAIMSVLTIAAISVWAYAGYKKYLAGKVADKFIASYISLPENKELLDMDEIDKHEFHTKMSSFMMKFSVMELRNLDKFSQEDILSISKNRK